MIVFFKERLVLLSVPKTGTTALHTAFRDRADMVVSGPPELKHSTIYRYNRFFLPMFEKACKAEMETIAVIREPVSWLGSWYRYRRRPDMKRQVNSTHDISFDDFVQAYSEIQQPSFAKIGSQSRFVDPRGKGPDVARLFRYEEPATLLTFLEARLGTLPKIARENISPQMPLELSADVKQNYRRRYSDEFSLYDSIV